MADTIQVIRWSLAYGCPIRKPEDWSNPTLSRAQAYSRAATAGGSFRNYDGIFVTSVTLVQIDVPRTGSAFKSLLNGPGVPSSGFFIEEEFSAAGGAAGLHELCGNCPANAALDGLAGCTGAFRCSHSPHSEELDQQLRELAEELGLTGALAQHFPATDLLWFGFWINSPLSPSGMKLLAQLLAAYAERHLSHYQEMSRQESSLLAFLRAIERAQYYNLDLRVEMTPPGHTDLGLYTIFAHCPRCKAGAPVRPWKKVRHAKLTCGMCGHEFDPALTPSAEPMPLDDDYDLRKQLGDERYRPFAIGYLLSRGKDLDYATAVVDKHLAPPDPAILEKRRQQELKSREKRLFICTVLCAGFERVQPDAGPLESRVSMHYLLTIEQAKVLFQRSAQWGARVSYINHHSQDDDLDDLSVSCRDFATPEDALQDLINQGCIELFSVTVGISDDAFEAWKAQHDQ